MTTEREEALRLVARLRNPDSYENGDEQDNDGFAAADLIERLARAQPQGEPVGYRARDPRGSNWVLVECIAALPIGLQRYARPVFDAPPAQTVPEAWKCAARAGSFEPQDCNWPLCDCDPKATQVIEALQECGLLSAAPKPGGKDE